MFEKVGQNWQGAAQEIADEVVRLISDKQKDYGHGNILAFGELGILVRVNDKIERLKHLQKSLSPANEAIDDSWLDLAGYAIIALMVRRGTFELRLMGEHD